MSGDDLSPGLLLVHGNQPESLRQLMLTWLRQQPLRPLESEAILVQSNGVAQWLKLAFAADGGDGVGGIAAALDFFLPSQFVWRVYRAVLGREAVPEVSPFDKPRLGWRLMRLLPALLEQAVFEPLRHFLADDPDQRKLFQLAERLADLFDQYQVYRADWLQAWSAGESIWIDAAGARHALPESQSWQPQLWRVIEADVAADPHETGAPAGLSRAAVHTAFLARARAWPAGQQPVGLPRRVVVFGVSALPAQALEVLAVLARWSQVLVCVHNPSQHYWGDLTTERDGLRSAARRQARRQGMPDNVAPEALHWHAHPLLAAWGKQGCDFIALLDGYDQDAPRAEFQRRAEALGLRIDMFESPGGQTLLTQLQDDVLDLRPLHETQAHWPALDAEQDPSLRFHIAHSPQREVEVLHDQLLAAFNADPTLAPRDIVVMAPDIEAYVPHIQAVFGLYPRADARHIPYSVTDLGSRQTLPLWHAVEQLLSLPHARLGVSDVWSLLETPALARRYGLPPEELPRLHRWIEGAYVRWGLTGEQRSRLDLPGAELAAPNTWLFGIRRMLLGYAVGRGSAWQGIEPYDEIGGLDAVWLGPLLRLLEDLERTWRTLCEPASVPEWCMRLRDLLNTFFDASDDREAYALLQLEQSLQSWQDACTEARLTEPLGVAVVADHWLSQLDGGGLSQRFFAGSVTFASLMPMRAIPFRHVYLLGMNDGAYPRSRVPMDFDLMAWDYRPGDRSRRRDDQYLFLEALLSARERLCISWVGRSVNDNTARAPSVLVAQLRDHLAAGWRLAGVADDDVKAGDRLLQALTTEHRLQPFSPAYFGSDARWFTYAHEWHRSHQPLPSADVQPLPARPADDTVSVRDWVAFLKDPVRAFFQQRLGVHFDPDDAATEDNEPFELDGLARWALQDELIAVQVQALAEGRDPAQALEQALASLRRRGAMPAGAFGRVAEAALTTPMADWIQRYQRVLAAWPHAVEEEPLLQWSGSAAGEPLSVSDSLNGLRRNDQGAWVRVCVDSSDLVVQGHYRGDRLTGPWLLHLLAQEAVGAMTTMVVGKVGTVTLRPVEPQQAAAHLQVLAQAWREGLRRPLPLAPRSAFEWLRVLQPGGGSSDAAKAREAARKVYEGGYQQTGELQRSPYLQRVYPTFDALSASGEFAAWAESLLRPLQQAWFAEPANPEGTA